MAAYMYKNQRKHKKRLLYEDFDFNSYKDDNVNAGVIQEIISDSKKELISELLEIIFIDV